MAKALTEDLCAFRVCTQFQVRVGGFGLTIVKDSVRDMGGKVRAIAHGELGGAEFVVELPISGS